MPSYNRPGPGGISRRNALLGASAGIATLAMPRLGRAADDTIRIG
ncbi:MAG: ABC transporter substrate-binding protein, partial [Bradyrhizobium sp.]